MRIAGFVGGALLLLAVVLYFVATSTAVFKGIILPRVGKTLNAELTVTDARIRPFSKVTLHELKVTPRGAEPLVTASELRVRYRLMSILRGNLVLDELALVNPTVTLVQDAKGRSNLDPILEAFPPEEPKPPQPAKPAEPVVLNLKLARLENATLCQTTVRPDGGRDVIEITGLNLTARNLANNQTGRVEMSAALAMEQPASAAQPAASVRAAVQGALDVQLAADLMPGAVRGNATLTVQQATGAFAELGGLAVRLDANTTPTEISDLAVRFARAGTPLGELRAHGPFDAVKREGKVRLELTGVDRRLLNLAGAGAGLDFGNTTVSAVTDVELSRAGQQLALAGEVNLARFQVTQAGQTTPALDLRGAYQATVDQTAETVVVRKLDFVATQNQRPLLRTELTAPLTLAWGDKETAVGDAILTLTLQDLDLADWNPFVGELAPAGRVQATARLTSRQAGRLVEYELMAEVAQLTVLLDTNRISPLDGRLQLRGDARELKQFNLAALQGQLRRRQQLVLSAEAAGDYTLADKRARTDFTVTAQLAPLVSMLALPDITVSSGTLEARAQFTQKGDNQVLTGRATLARFTGAMADVQLTNWEMESDFDLALTGERVQLRKLVGALTSGGQPAGRFDLTGNFDLSTQAGEGALKLAGLNQHALGPFLAGALGSNQLVSATLDSSASVSLAANGDAAVKADAHLANLVVQDPKGALPKTPLEARLQADASKAKDVVQLRQVQLTLTPTERAKNQLALTGQVQLSDPNAITGELKLAADSLDLTRYYDLFLDQPDAATPATPSPAAAPVTEPEAVTLPVRNFTAEMNLGRLLLREIEATNLQARLWLDGGRIRLAPCRMALNGAPVEAHVEANLTVPGYQYAMTLQTGPIPLPPLVNSFLPERKGQVGGTTLAQADLKGAGITGASLAKHLTGNFAFAATNLNLSVGDVRNPVLNTILNVIVGIPNFIRDPTAAVGNLLARLTGTGGARTGWADRLTAAPIDSVVLRGQAGGGRVDLREARVRSAAFLAEATGGITLAPILTNSPLQIPVMVSLSYPLANEVGLVPAGTPTNAPYVKLPDFVSLQGTLGVPEAKINKLALAAVALKTGAGVAGRTGSAAGEKVADVLAAIGGVLGGGSPSPTNPPAGTNPPPADPMGGLLRGVGDLLRGGKSPTAATNQPTPPR